jgi:hypothetical protein
MTRVRNEDSLKMTCSTELSSSKRENEKKLREGRPRQKKAYRKIRERKIELK